MIGSWVLSAVLRFSSNGDAVMSRLSANAKRLAADQERLSESAKRLGLEQERIGVRTAAAQANYERSMGIIDKKTAAELRYSRAQEMIAIQTQALANKNDALAKKEAALFAQREIERKEIIAENAHQMQVGIVQNGLIAAAAGIGAISFGVNEAAQLQKRLTTLNIVTGATPSQANAMRRMALQVSSLTAQSVSTIADEMGAAASAGLNDPKQLMGSFRQIARAADIEFIRTGADPTETVSQLSSFAHLFGAYQGKPLQDMLDDANRLRMMFHGNYQQLVTQGRMFIPSAVGAGVSEKDIITYAAIMGQTGFLKGRGGTALNNIIRWSQGAESMNAHMSKARTIAMGAHELALRDSHGRFQFSDPQGHLLLDKMLHHLYDVRNAFIKQDQAGGAARFLNDVSNAFGVEGARLVNLLAQKNIQDQMKRNRDTLARLPSIDKAWKEYSQTFLYVWSQFTTNFRNVVIAVFYPMLPKLTGFFQGLADALASVGSYLEAHPTINKGVSTLLVGGTGILSARVAIGALVLAVQAMGRAMDATALGITRDATAVSASAATALGFWGWVDRVFFAGLFGWASGLFGKLGGFISGFLLKFNKLTAWAADFTALATNIETAVGKIAIGLGKLSIPLSVLASVLGYQTPAGEDEAKPLMGQTAAYWKNYAKHHGWNAVPRDVQRGLHHVGGDTSGRAHGNGDVHIHGPVHIHGVRDKDHLVSILDGLRHTKGSPSIRTSPTLPVAMSFG